MSRTIRRAGQRVGEGVGDRAEGERGLAAPSIDLDGRAERSRRRDPGTRPALGARRSASVPTAATVAVPAGDLREPRSAASVRAIASAPSAPPPPMPRPRRVISARSSTSVRRSVRPDTSPPTTAWCWSRCRSSRGSCAGAELAPRPSRGKAARLGGACRKATVSEANHARRRAARRRPTERPRRPTRRWRRARTARGRPGTLRGRPRSRSSRSFPRTPRKPWPAIPRGPFRKQDLLSCERT